MPKGAHLLTPWLLPLAVEGVVVRAEVTGRQWPWFLLPNTFLSLEICHSTATFMWAKCGHWYVVEWPFQTSAQRIFLQCLEVVFRDSTQKFDMKNYQAFHNLVHLSLVWEVEETGLCSSPLEFQRSFCPSRLSAFTQIFPDNRHL